MPEHVEKWRAAHHAALASIFGLPADEGKQLWKALVKLENKAHKAAEDFCNGDIDDAAWEKIKAEVTIKVNRLARLDGKVDGFFVNGDPRGYALKISDEQARNIPGLHRDWGGYGCLAARID
jgi:hypothetical protein